MFFQSSEYDLEQGEYDFSIFRRTQKLCTILFLSECSLLSPPGLQYTVVCHIYILPKRDPRMKIVSGHKIFSFGVLSNIVKDLGTLLYCLGTYFGRFETISKNHLEIVFLAI